MRYKEGVAVFEGIDALRLDRWRAIFRKIEELQIKRRMAALALMIPERWHQLTMIVNAFCVIKQTVPIIPFGSAINQVSRHDVKRGVGAETKRISDECAPSVEPILRVAHRNE